MKPGVVGVGEPGAAVSPAVYPGTWGEGDTRQ